MGWETRGNGTYYYSKRRVGSRVISEYIGSGPHADAIASIEELTQAEQTWERFRWQCVVSADDKYRNQVIEHGKIARQLRRTILPMLGCYQHKGQWRKRRMKDHLPDADDVIALLAKHNPTKKDIAQWAKWLNDIPELAGYHSLQTTIEEMHYKHMFDDKFIRQTTRKQVAIMRDEMMHDRSPIWERLVIDQVIVTWLRLQYVEYHLARADNDRAHVFWEKRVNASQRRHLQAISCLARIRKLNLPNIQVNIGENQVNLSA